MLADTVHALRAAGCVAAEEEAAELMSASSGDPARLGDLVARRIQGTPLAWLVGSVTFCGVPVLVHPGVYVPRWQSEPLALEAVRRLPRRGTAVDLCTGSGALAVVLARHRPDARVLATENDPLALACARANGVVVYECDLAGGLPDGIVGLTDVVTAVAPYVPADQLHLLPRDVLAHEPRSSLDGGAGGTEVLCGVIVAAARLLRPGGSLLVEIGGNQAADLVPPLTRARFGDLVVLSDEDGDTRGLCCRLA